MGVLLVSPSSLVKCFFNEPSTLTLDFNPYPAAKHICILACQRRIRYIVYSLATIQPFWGKP